MAAAGAASPGVAKSSHLADRSFKESCAQRMTKTNLITAGSLALATLFANGCSGGSASSTAAKGKGDPAARTAVPVAAATVTAKDVPVYLRGLGNVTAFNTVTVHTRVDGQLVQINFKEGQEVKKGDLLAVIDPRPFQAALDQAKATLAKDEAALTDLNTNLVRFEALAKEGVIAQQQLDTQRSQVGAQQGQIGAEKAQIENAALQLSYTRITAPIPGRIGLRLVDVGNIVHAADANGLLVITQLQPIATLFTLPEDNVPDVLHRMRNGPLNVDAYTRDDKTKIASGQLVTVNNEIDPTTGTDRFKAVFQNEDRMLWPNQFVNIRLLLQVDKNALTIPVAALQRGAQGTFVYVVKPDQTVESRQVTAAVTEGGIVSITKGLSAGEVVVTDGQDKLQPGARVAVQQDRGPGGAQASGGSATGNR